MNQKRVVVLGVLDGKVVIITGAGRGQGETTARLFAEEGAKLVLTDRDGANVRQVAASLGESAIWLEHDITDEPVWASVVDMAIERFGAVNVLLNNAGIFFGGGVTDATQADMERAFSVNVTGAFLGVQAVAPNMRRTGGSIINVASAAGMRGMEGMTAYCTSKWALRGMTRAMSRDLAQFGIRVNAVCPGVIDTPMIRNDDIPDFFQQVAKGIPLGRAGVPQDIAGASLFLASDASSFMTGSDVVIDGGRTA